MLGQSDGRKGEKDEAAGLRSAGNDEQILSDVADAGVVTVGEGVEAIGGELQRERKRRRRRRRWLV